MMVDNPTLWQGVSKLFQESCAPSSQGYFVQK